MNHKRKKVQTEPITDLAKAMGGGNIVPLWKRNLDRFQREKAEEGLKYAGGPTGEDLEKEVVKRPS